MAANEAKGYSEKVDDLREIEDAASKITAQGARYPERLEEGAGR
jgi:hypothetical protein